jgi:hypothetical protein
MIAGRPRRLALLCGVALLAASTRTLAADACTHAFNHREVVQALTEIAASVDPCGQSSEIIALLERFRVCAQNAYPICIDRAAERNSTDRAAGEAGGRVFITWNPDLESELQTGCGADSTRSVRRDPKASLLHEIAHAVQDCSGLDPNAHELEAVRIENIYRRAKHLCQRTAYGAQKLPDAMLLQCQPGACPCTPGIEARIAYPLRAPEAAGAANTAGDGARTQVGP